MGHPEVDFERVLNLGRGRRVELLAVVPIRAVQLDRAGVLKRSEGMEKDPRHWALDLFHDARVRLQMRRLQSNGTPWTATALQIVG